MGHSYGWVPSPPDPRDYDLSPSEAEQALPLPAEFSLRSHMPPVYDQGQLGSCTANAIGGSVEYQQMRQGEVEATPSRLFIYWNERKIEGTVNQDAGAVIRDGMKVVATIGAPPESDWPYDIAKFREKPPAQAFTDAKLHEATVYGRVTQTQLALQTSIHNHRPVVFGFTVYESFESQAVADNGIVPMPRSGEQILGGHAVLAVGWKPINGDLYFECRNSWGPDWGDAGYFWMPAAYLEDSSLASDLWHIKLES